MKSYLLQVPLPQLPKSPTAERTVQKLRELKNSSRRNIEQNPGEFHSISRAYNKALKSLNDSVSSKNLQRHEKAFKSNPWAYSKKLCSSSPSSVSHTCTAEETHLHFSTILKAFNQYQSLLQWPDQEELTPFDLSPITPSLVKRVLKKRSSNSFPWRRWNFLPSLEEGPFSSPLSSNSVLQDSSDVSLCTTHLE